MLKIFGIVLKAIQKSTGEMVAIKQFRDTDSFVSNAEDERDSLGYSFKSYPNIIHNLDEDMFRSFRI